MKTGAIRIDGDTLTIEQVGAVARHGARVSLTPRARRRMRQSRTHVDRAVRGNKPVYGVTTGFGWFQNISIPPEKLRELQRNLILSHCAGVGEPLPEEVVRAMLLLRSNALAKGFSGIRVSTVESLLEMLNCGVHPVVPSQGSVGASGDLAPLSHMAAVLIGEGEAVFRGRRMSGKRALRGAGLSPVVLEAKEGLALNNGTQAMTAIAALAVIDAEQLAAASDVAAAMTLEAVKGKKAPFTAEALATRPYPGQALSARAIRALIRGSELVDLADDDTRGKIQDSYSLRCAPQVHGASREAIGFVRRIIQTEINSATDNPLVLNDGTFVNVGNFHGQPVALVMDVLALAASELGSISERRTAKLVDKFHSYGLPPFLATNGGLESGLMIAQYTAAALASENKVLIHPASGDSIPTSANQEDHVSMGTIAARQARTVIDNVRLIIAIEMLCASQALEYRKERPGAGTRRAVQAVRSVSPPLRGDRVLSQDIERVAGLISSGVLNHIVP